MPPPWRAVIHAGSAGAALAVLFLALSDVRSHLPVSTTNTTAHPVPQLTGFQSAVRKAAPAVVSIRTAIPPRNANERLQMGLGSGVVLSADGYIVTNYHVIQSAEAIAIEVMDGHAYTAHIVGVDAATDLAVLKVDKANLTPINIAMEDSSVGEIVLAIGYPFLLGQTVTQGIVSATERLERGFIRLVQTDAAINRGNSGGALVNTRGELIGINSEVLPSQLGVQGIGFAIPTDLVQKIVEQILKHGHVIRGSIGFTGSGSANDMHADAEHWRDNAVQVDSVDDNGPAAHAGLQTGDYITQFNGDTIAGMTDLLQRISETAPGASVHLGVKRKQENLEMTVVVIERQPDVPQ